MQRAKTKANLPGADLGQWKIYSNMIHESDFITSYDNNFGGFFSFFEKLKEKEWAIETKNYYYSDFNQRIFFKQLKADQKMKKKTHRSEAPMLRRITLPPRFNAEDAKDAAAAAAEDATVEVEAAVDDTLDVEAPVIVEVIPSDPGVVLPFPRLKPYPFWEWWRWPLPGP